ncbi:MAG: low molecular weight phosphatase family protein [Candidatus Acidiferrales bacterium]|jgi:arsenate reductase
MPQPVKVLFVCMGNCVRSQMAEAIARHESSDIIEPESAGVSPLGFIDNTTQRVLRERGISFEGQFSKGLRAHSLVKPDLIVNMSGIPGASLFAGQPFEDWRVQDPFGEDIEIHRRVCDDIEARVKDLSARLRRTQTEQAANPEERSEGASS